MSYVLLRTPSGAVAYSVLQETEALAQAGKISVSPQELFYVMLFGISWYVVNKLKHIFHINV